MPDRVKRGILRTHVNVAHGPDHSFWYLEEAGRAHQHAARRVLDVAGNPQRNIEAKRDRIRVSQLHLVQVPAGAENAEIGNDPAPRANQRDRFLGRELPVLIQPLVRLQLVAAPEKPFDCLLGEMTMPRADVHNQAVGRGRRPRQRQIKPLVDDFSNQLLYLLRLG